MADVVKEIKLTEKCAAVLAYLQANDNGEDGYTGAVIAESTGMNPKGIHGIMNSLVKYDLVGKGAKVKCPAVDKDGNKVERDYATYHLTEAGRAFAL